MCAVRDDLMPGKNNGGAASGQVAYAVDRRTAIQEVKIPSCHFDQVKREVHGLDGLTVVRSVFVRPCDAME